MPETRESFKFDASGALTVGVGKDRWIAPAPGEVLGVEAVVGVAPTGAALIFDITKNGTSLFQTATKPTIADGATKTAAKATPDTGGSARFTTGDVLSCDVTQIGSSVAGTNADVVVEFVYS